MLPQITPKTVLKEAISAKIIDERFMFGWRNMLKDRNLMSYTYDSKIFDKVTCTV